MPTTNELAYIAGLFDGEGCIQCKQIWEAKQRKNKPRRYKVWRITMEISMTDKDLIEWVHKTLDVGTVLINIKNKSPSSKPHWKTQWRWRCGHRQAYKVCKMLWPYIQLKLPQVEKIIDHYEPEFLMNDKVVSLHQYKINMDME
tara:strand:+ start:150 stop:581 length:432 start_codon:yes stop_codon:yes gene_type:complete